jgi:hypothetical protein
VVGHARCERRGAALSTRTWLALLLACGIVIRAGLWVIYEPVTFPDTTTYVAAARDLLDGGLARSEGRRPPGYPALMLAASLNPNGIVVLQLLGGLLASALLFHIALETTGRPGFAFLVGMTYNANLQQIMAEFALLSESLSTLTVLAVVAATIRVCRDARAGAASIGWLLLLGASAGVAILVRPQFVFLLGLVPLLVVATTRNLRTHVSLGARNAAVVLAPIVLMVAAWSACVYQRTGYFALSTQAGLGLVNHSVAFVESAPERYATLRSILLKDRAVKLAEQGHYGNVGWLALPEIRKATGMTLPQVSHELQRMSFELFAMHPLGYAKSALQSWVEFWTAPILWQPERIVPQSFATALTAIWWVENKLLRLANLAFVVLALAALAWPRARAATGWGLELGVIAAVVGCSSIVQALADHGASGRYAITVQALIVLVVLTACAHLSGAAAREGGGRLRAS